MVADTFERIEWTDAVSTAFREIKARLEHKGRPIEDFDAAIAAHAVANAATLVSANVARRFACAMECARGRDLPHARWPRACNFRRARRKTPAGRTRGFKHVGPRCCARHARLLRQGAIHEPRFLPALLQISFLPITGLAPRGSSTR